MPKIRKDFSASLCSSARSEHHSHKVVVGSSNLPTGIKADLKVQITLEIARQFLGCPKALLSKHAHWHHKKGKMIADLLVNQATALISAVSYWGVFLLMALESTMFPLPSELVMPFAGFLVANGTFDFWIALLMSTLGCLAGSLFSYYLGYHGGMPFVRRFGRYFLMNEGHLKKSEQWFAKRGKITIFIGRFIPGVRHVISIPAGVGKMDVFPFACFTFLGAGIWNAILLYAGYLLEKNWQLVYHYTEYVDMLIVFVVAIAVVYYIAYVISNYRKKRGPNLERVVKHIRKKNY